MDSLFNLGVIVRMRDMLSGPARQVRQSIAAIEETAGRARQIASFGAKVAGVGAVLTAAGAVGRAGIEDMLDPFRELQDEAAILQTVWTSTSGTVGESVGRAVQEARRWSRTNTDTAGDFLRASFLMASAGLNDVQAIEGTRNALMLAANTKGEAMAAANLLASVYNNLGNRTNAVGDEMALLSDKLSRTQQAFQFKDLAQLEASLSHSASSALGFGIELDELLAVMGQLNTTFLQGSPAGTAFSATLRKLMDANEKLGFGIAKTESGGIDFIGTLERIRNKFGEFAEMSDLTKQKLQDAFQARGLQSLQLLLPQIDRLRSGLEAVRTAAGTNEKGMKILGSTVSAELRVMQNEVNDLKVELGGLFVPELRELKPQVMAIISAFREWKNENPELASTLVQIAFWGTVIATVLGPVIALVGAFLGAAAALVVILANWAVAKVALAGVLALFRGLVVGAIAAVLRLATTLAVNLIVALVRVVLLLEAMFVGLVRAVVWLGRMAIALTGKLLTGLRLVAAASLANPLVLLGLLIAVGIALAIRHWDKFKAAIVAGLEWVGSKLDAVRGWFVGLWTDATDAGADFIDWLARLPGRGLTWIRKAVVGWLAELRGFGEQWANRGKLFVDELRGGMELAWKDLKRWFKNALNSLVDLVPDGLVDALEFVLGSPERSLSFGVGLPPLAQAGAVGQSRRAAVLSTPQVEIQADRAAFPGPKQVSESLSRENTQRLASLFGGRSGGGETTTFHIERVTVKADNAEDLAKSLKSAARESA